MQLAEHRKCLLTWHNRRQCTLGNCQIPVFALGTRTDVWPIQGGPYEEERAPARECPPVQRPTSPRASSAASAAYCADCSSSSALCASWTSRPDSSMLCTCEHHLRTNFLANLPLLMEHRVMPIVHRGVSKETQTHEHPSMG